MVQMNEKRKYVEGNNSHERSHLHLISGRLGGWPWAPRLMLKGLNLRSSSRLDFHFTSKEMFQESLPQPTGLKTFIFTGGKVSDEDVYLPLLSIVSTLTSILLYPMLSVV